MEAQLPADSPTEPSPLGKGSNGLLFVVHGENVQPREPAANAPASARNFTSPVAGFESPTTGRF
jgi:hypothetical protein